MPIKAVIDTNIWVSALLNPGTARQIVHYLQADGFQNVCSNELLAELFRVISRPKITATVSLDDIDELLTLIQDKALFIDLNSIPVVSRDPKDNIFLACAIDSKSEFLVSGDQDLLCLSEYKDTKIVTPAQFLEILKSLDE